MEIDWTALAVEVGSLDPANPTIERGGGHYPLRALERIIGPENIARAVQHILSFAPGSELAMDVLRHIRSQEALDLAYREYRGSSGERAAQAVWLIKNICHPRALAWVEEFLRDDNVAVWGIGVLDQLLWTEAVDSEDEAVPRLIALAEAHHIENVREQVAFIKEYLSGRDYDSTE
jgi:hypothetical protein